MPVSNDAWFYIPLELIQVPERMRQNFTSDDFKKISALETSIRTYGQFSPILITRELELVAGHRRLICMQRLNRPVIKALYYDPNSQVELLAVELEENIRRLEMDWRSIVLGVGKFHFEMKKVDVTWDLRNSSLVLGIPGRTVQKAVSIFPFRNHPRILSAKRFTNAYTESRQLKKEALNTELQQL